MKNRYLLLLLILGYQLPLYADSWAPKADFGGVARGYAVGFSIGSKGYIGTGHGNSPKKDFWEYDPTTNVWTQKADFGGTARYSAVGFSIGSKGYIGTGYDGTYRKDFWEYDPTTNVWTQRADFGGTARVVAIGFSIGSKGYLGIGEDNYSYKKDFWEYDPSTNAWTQKADFGGTARGYAVGFSIGSKGYIGTGYDGTSKKDFWEYNPNTNAWVQKADFGGAAREWTVGFSIGAKGFLGGGQDSNSVKNDFWEYNPTANIWTQKTTGGSSTGYILASACFVVNSKAYVGTGWDGYNYTNKLYEYIPDVVSPPIQWTQKANFGGVARRGAVAFSIGNKGYMGTGVETGTIQKKDFWEYNPLTNVWTQKADFGGGAREVAVGFSIGQKGYIGTGEDNVSRKNDFWEYDPVSNSWTQKADFGGEPRIYATGFGLGDYGYIGTGFTNSSIKKDFWQYNPATNTWIQKADLGGQSRYIAVGFSIGSKGYIGTGVDATDVNRLRDFWEYDPTTNAWTQKADFGGTGRVGASGFSIGNKGYIGTGYDVAMRDDFWEYNPTNNTWTQKESFGGGSRGYCSGFSINDKGYIGLGFDASGRKQDFWEYSTTIINPNIIQLEYFFDADPGYGAGTAVSGYATNDTINYNFNVPVASLSDGFHFLSFRTKDANNTWGMVGIRPFYKESLPASAVNINQIEYFIDEYPSTGTGIVVNFTATNQNNIVSTIPLNNTLADGFHFLFLRAKDVNNNWSIIGSRPFYKESLTSTTLPNIVAMEYFIDTDPGYGLGTAVNFAANSPVFVNFAASLSNLATGTHKLYIRAKDANNKWSIVNVKDFTISDTYTIVNSIPTAWCPNTNFTINFNANGTYNAGNIFTAQLSDANGSFTNPTTIGVISGTNSGSITATIPNGTSVGVGYKVRITSSNPLVTDNPSVAFNVVAACPNPCATTLTLVSTADDFSSGVLVKEANASTGIIIASNKVTGTSKVTYRAGKSITLNAGFKADNGTVFKTEFGGCNN